MEVKDILSLCFLGIQVTFSKLIYGLLLLCIKDSCWLFSCTQFDGLWKHYHNTSFKLCTTVINSLNNYTYDNIAKILDIFELVVRFSSDCIPRGKSFAFLLADLFLYLYEAEFIQGPLKQTHENSKWAFIAPIKLHYIAETGCAH